MKYCRNLRLNGDSGWRLANVAEMQVIYDRNVNASGLVGYSKHLRPFTWHVKGNLFLTAINADCCGRENCHPFAVHESLPSAR